MHNMHVKHCMSMNSRLERDTPSFSGFHLLEEGMGKLLSFFFFFLPSSFLPFRSFSFILSVPSLVFLRFLRRKGLLS